MKGKKKVLEGLGEVLCAELTAINQYFVHHTLCEDWGFDLLAKATKVESIDEMKHAEMLSERMPSPGGTWAGRRKTRSCGGW